MLIFRSLNAENLKSLDQRASKSNFENDRSGPGNELGLNALAHKLGGMAEAADFFLRTPTLTASNFAAL